MSLITQPSSHTNLLMSALTPNFLKDLNIKLCFLYLFPVELILELILAAVSL